MFFKYLFLVLSLPSLILVFALDAMNLTDIVNGYSNPSSTISPSPSSSTPPPCNNLPGNHGFPQLVFPLCTSSRGSEGLRNVIIHGMACTCDINTHNVNKRDDYYYVPVIGAYKFHVRGVNFNNARKICNEEGAHLAIIDSLAEEKILLELFLQSEHLLKNVTSNEQAYIGIHDLYAEGDWVTILGDSIHKNGYTKWSTRWGGQPDNGGGVQHCGTLLKEGGMDDASCNALFGFFCEIPEIRIAH